jgi:hypothetical protein
VVSTSGGPSRCRDLHISRVPRRRRRRRQPVAAVIWLRRSRSRQTTHPPSHTPTHHHLHHPSPPPTHPSTYPPPPPRLFAGLAALSFCVVLDPRALLSLSLFHSFRSAASTSAPFVQHLPSPSAADADDDDGDDNNGAEPPTPRPTVQTTDSAPCSEFSPRTVNPSRRRLHHHHIFPACSLHEPRRPRRQDKRETTPKTPPRLGPCPDNHHPFPLDRRHRHRRLLSWFTVATDQQPAL